jgi:hypothetical protein
MKRLATSAVAAALLAAGTAGQAQAQDMMGRRASQFDLGIYGGGAYTTDWFTTPEQGGEEEGWAPGFSSIFGAVAQFWFSPSLGVRLHGAYMPQRLPQAENFDPDALVVNSYLYDLDLVFRPFFSSAAGIMPSVYFFLGGGGYTADIGDYLTPGVADDEIRCIRQATWLRNGVCVSTHRDYATVGQGTVGVGADFFPLGPVTLFGEVAVHGYDSPAHVVNENATGEDKFTFTPRAVLGLKALFGDILPPPPVIDTPPPPPIVVPDTPPPPPPAGPTMTDIQVCVVQDGNLMNVNAQYSSAGDTTVNGQPFASAHPMGAQYAGNATWYINNEPVMFQNRRFVKYGLPRVLGVNEVTRVGEFQGVSLFAEMGQTRPDVVYVPVRPGCEFQPYQVETKTGSVRGE